MLFRSDVLVDSIARHQLLSFVDAFSSYNQIKMDEVDQEKTLFVTNQDIFCYKVMSFGLKNGGCNVLEAHEQNICTSNWEKCPSLCG